MSPNLQRGPDEPQNQVKNDVEPAEQTKRWRLDSCLEREETWSCAER